MERSRRLVAYAVSVAVVAIHTYPPPDRNQEVVTRFQSRYTLHHASGSTCAVGTGDDRWRCGAAAAAARHARGPRGIASAVVPGDFDGGYGFKYGEHRSAHRKRSAHVERHNVGRKPELLDGVAHGAVGRLLPVKVQRWCQKQSQSVPQSFEE